MNKAAQALGRLARGKPKRFTPAQLEAARQRLEYARRIKAENKLKIPVDSTKAL